MHILIIKTSSLGDIIHTLPAITDLSHSIPDLKIDWVVEENFAEIPAWHPAINRTITVAIRHWKSHPFATLKRHEIRQTRQKLKLTNYDFVIDAQGLLKSAVIALATKGIRCGMDYKSAREPLAAMCYTRKYYIDKNQHAITRIRELFGRALNYEQPSTHPDFGIIPYFSQNRTAEKENNYLVFIHGSARNEKCWHVDYWHQLAKRAINANYTIKLPWGNQAELERAERIAQSLPNVIVMPKSNLTTIAQTLFRATGVVAVDTGLGHLAAALNIPTISLYGPTNAKLIGTVGKNISHITAPRGELANLDPARVWEELRTLLTNTK